MGTLSRNLLRLNSVRALVLISLVTAPRAAAAEPITITSGYVETQILASLARGLLEGAGFFLSFGADGFAAAVARDCVPCTPGSTVNFGAEFNLPRVSGSAAVDGVTYPTIFLAMTGIFSSPSFQVTGAQTAVLSRPFSYSGSIIGYLVDPWTFGATEPVFTKELVGQGTATATFVYVNSEFDGPVFTATDLRYDFADAAPIPEPATLFLCGAGTALLIARRRRWLNGGMPPVGR
jgi:hypothetical protein